jgi:hypothetical protein
LGFSGFAASEFLMNLAAGSTTAAMVLYWTTWRLSLRTDDRPRIATPAPGAVGSVAGLMLSPLRLIFSVLNCPHCGHHVAGRRRLLHCGHCGWCDKVWG